MNVDENTQVCLAEEAGEVAYAAFELGFTALAVSKTMHKSLRFGVDDHNPQKGKSNANDLAAELNDLQALVEMIQEAGVVLPNLGDRDSIDAKKEKVKRYLELSKELGRVQNDLSLAPAELG